MCNIPWVAFGDGVKTKTFFKWYMYFLTMILEDDRCKFIACLVAKVIQVVCIVKLATLIEQLNPHGHGFIVQGGKVFQRTGV